MPASLGLSESADSTLLSRVQCSKALLKDDKLNDAWYIIYARKELPFHECLSNSSIFLLAGHDHPVDVASRVSPWFKL